MNDKISEATGLLRFGYAAIKFNGFKKDILQI